MQSHFEVFGAPVEILVTSQQTGGAFSIARQTYPPGGGTPPHLHDCEDKVYSVVSGDFEVFAGKTWARIAADGTFLAPRGRLHCFRNCGNAAGTIQFVCSGDRFDTFLQGLSIYNFPEDMQAIVDYAAGFGVRYPNLPPPSKPGRRTTLTRCLEAVDWTR